MELTDDFAYNDCSSPCQYSRDMGNDVKTLRRIVYEGNGVPSLVARMTSVERAISAMLWMTGSILVCVLGIAGTVAASLIIGHFH
jgi:hypothetical protein